MLLEGSGERFLFGFQLPVCHLSPVQMLGKPVKSLLSLDWPGRKAGVGPRWASFVLSGTGLKPAGAEVGRELCRSTRGAGSFLQAQEVLGNLRIQDDAPVYLRR